MVFKICDYDFDGFIVYVMVCDDMILDMLSVMIILIGFILKINMFDKVKFVLEV